MNIAITARRALDFSERRSGNFTGLFAARSAGPAAWRTDARRRRGARSRVGSLKRSLSHHGVTANIPAINTTSATPTKKSCAIGLLPLAVWDKLNPQRLRSRS